MTGGGAGGGGGGDVPGKLAQFGKKKDKSSTTDEPLIRFDDIRGIDGAKFEVMELVDALRYPDKYALLGARAPRGLLICGPPGTGSLKALNFLLVYGFSRIRFLFISISS